MDIEYKPDVIQAVRCESCNRLIDINTFHLVANLDIRNKGKETVVYAKNKVFCDKNCLMDFIKENNQVI